MGLRVSPRPFTPQQTSAKWLLLLLRTTSLQMGTNGPIRSALHRINHGFPHRKSQDAIAVKCQVPAEAGEPAGPPSFL